ncbi:MAG: NAD-dependent epimerase/dehydratase family protein, partial [Candidatus Pacebacteria bacterium]|nr:NAD-dependent epimerase/dehydratase family protein [Candidatus Paceibacterota bacterium]
MRVLITGGCGFIGSHLAEYYASRAEVRVLDNLRTGSLSNIEGLAVDFIRGSILDPDVLIQAMDGVDYVFHLAALVSVPESVEHPQECVDLNTKGTLNVLQAAVSAGAKKMCYSSSSAIYGNAKELPKHESMVPAPTSPYAVTKLSGEYYCQIASTQRGLPTASLRYFNVFGPRQDPDSPYAAAIPAFVSRAVNGDDVLIH